MKNFLYYCILKNYKGILKKKHVGNTHLFFIPVSDSETFYLALLGKDSKEKDTYICQLIVRVPNNLRVKLVAAEKDHFKDRYLVIEALKCESNQTDPSNFNIKIKKGKVVKSDLVLTYDPSLSSDKQKMYRLTGKLDLTTTEVKDQNVRMVAYKKLAFLDKLRFKK